MKMSEAQIKVTASMVAMLHNEPFFANVLMQHDRVEDPTCETLWINGKTLGFNPGYVMQLQPSLRLSALAHETLHIALGHHLRRGNRDPFIWNVACDYAVNAELKKCGYALGEGWLYEEAYADKTSEWIYDKILQQVKQNPKAFEGRGPGEVRPQPSDKGIPMDAAEVAAAEEELREILAQCAQSAKARGKLPGHLSRFVEEALKPKASWMELLRRWFVERSKDDYTWSRPNRRYLHTGFYFPERHSLRMGKVVVAVDWSGSIGNETIKRFFGELSELLESIKPMETVLVHFDHKVQKVERFGDGETIQALRSPGGGGTSFIPAMDWVLRQDERPAAMIYLTDLYGTFPEEPDFPVLWAVVGGATGAPFGEVVNID